jgi:hypothetical protein
MGIIWTIVAILIAIWVVGLIFDIVGGLIHILLIAIIALAIYGFIRRRV